MSRSGQSQTLSIETGPSAPAVPARPLLLCHSASSDSGGDQEYVGHGPVRFPHEHLITVLVFGGVAYQITRRRSASLGGREPAGW